MASMEFHAVHLIPSSGVISLTGGNEGSSANDYEVTLGTHTVYPGEEAIYDLLQCLMMRQGISDRFLVVWDTAADRLACYLIRLQRWYLLTPSSCRYRVASEHPTLRSAETLATMQQYAPLGPLPRKEGRIVCRGPDPVQPGDTLYSCRSVSVYGVEPYLEADVHFRPYRTSRSRFWPEHRKLDTAGRGASAGMTMRRSQTLATCLEWKLYHSPKWIASYKVLNLPSTKNGVTTTSSIEGARDVNERRHPISLDL